MSSFVDSIKNAVVPDAAVTSNPQPENDIPGAFPDSDDEQEVEKHIQTNLAQGISESTRRERDSNPNTTATTTTTLPDRTRQQDAADRDFVLSNESLGLSPDKHEIPRSESMVHHRGSHHAGSELPEPANNNDEAAAEKRAREEEGAVAAEVVAAADALAGEQQQPQQQSGFAMADKKTTTSQVRPQHLGNEGTTPAPRSPTTGEVKEERPAGQAQAQAAPASSTVNADSASESLRQYSGTGSSGLDNNNNKLKAPGNGGIRNGVLGRGDSHLGPHLGISRPARPGEQEQKNRSPAAAATGETNPAAGVDNCTVRGEDVIDEESHKEGRRASRSSAGSSGSKKARAEAVHLSGVSDSGLGLGGVHNGVVGHGSHDEEDTRHSTSSEAVQQPASTTA